MENRPFICEKCGVTSFGNYCTECGSKKPDISNVKSPFPDFVEPDFVEPEHWKKQETIRVFKLALEEFVDRYVDKLNPIYESCYSHLMQWDRDYPYDLKFYRIMLGQLTRCAKLALGKDMSEFYKLFETPLSENYFAELERVAKLLDLIVKEER